MHVSTAEAAAAARAAYGAGLGCFGLDLLVHALSGGRMLVANVQPPVSGPDGVAVHIVDGLVTAQSFNYAFAKRIQHWRAAVEFEAGAIVSSMVAPSTATISVIHNVTFAWGYGGMPFYGYEIFKQDKTNAIMASILLNDVLNPASHKNPANRKAAGIATALELFRTESVHGGLWRAPYTVESLGLASVLVHFASVARPYIVAAALVAAAGVQYTRSTGALKF